MNVNVTVTQSPDINIALGAIGPKGRGADRAACVMVSPSDPAFGELDTGDSKAVIRAGEDLDGMVLSGVGAGVTAPSTLGAITIQVRRVRAGVGVDMLTTPITIEANEYDSITAAVQPVINAANDDILEGDMLHFDIDAAGTGVLGLVASLYFQPA